MESRFTGWQQETYQCCKDPVGGLYAVYCLPCMLCEIQPILSSVPPNNAGPIINGRRTRAKGLPAVCPALCLGSCFYCAICCCRQNMVPCYVTTAIKAVRIHNPGLPPLGPCGESECCGAYCNLLFPFSAPCTICALYSEAKYMKKNGGGQAEGMVQVQPVVGEGAPAGTEMTR